MYQVDSVLGKGTYGKVYGVSSLLTRRSFALKRLLIDPKAKGDFILSLREIDMMARMVHPHVMPLTEVLFSPIKLSPLTEMKDDQIALIMPRADMTVDRYITKTTTFRDRKELLWQILVGLEHIHRQDVIHRDLKPQNLLLFKQEEGMLLRIGDFGLAAPYIQGEPRTPQMVTIWYRAPEILLEQDYDMRSDVWSAGCIFYELITGRALFPESEEEKMLDSIFSLLGAPAQRHFTLIQRRKRAYVALSELKGRSLALHREMGLTASQLEEFDRSSGSYREFIDILTQMLSLDPKTRPNCTQLLRHEYFDGYRPQLSCVTLPPPCQDRLRLHPDREVGIKLIDRQNYGIQYRVKFLAVDILDRILALEPEIGDEACEIRKYAIVALYLAEKYLMGERACSFQELTSNSEEDFEEYGAREEYVVRRLLKYHIYRRTLYDYLPSDVIPREISRAYLLFRKALPFTGIRLDELYSIYNFVVEHYYDSGGWGERVFIACDLRVTTER